MGQLMVSFRGLLPPAWVLEGVAAGEIAAICLFAYNVDSPQQLRSATDALHQAARDGGLPPPLIGIDQEGGQLMAVTGGTTELPGNMALGATGSEELAERAGRVLGLELLALGCNVNFAPVLDLAGHLESAVVGTRAFGDDPAQVAGLGAALIRGMQQTGVVATAKHFPGHGDTALDSHRLAPVVSRTRSELLLRELVPFKAAIEAGVGAIMSAHVRYPDLDEPPASLSKAILGTLLREELGYVGLAITDAMDMQAVADGPAELRVRQAIDAGADLVLLGHLPDQQQLLQLSRPHFRPESLERITAARERLPRSLPELANLGRQSELAQEIADRAITAVRGQGLPLRLDAGERLGLVTAVPSDLSPADTSSAVELRLAQQLAKRHGWLEELSLPPGASEADVSRLLARLEGCSLVVAATVNAVSDPGQQRLLAALAESGTKVVHLALRSPADSAFSPEHVPCLCTYGIRRANTEAAARVLFGEMDAEGRLPVRLPERQARVA